MKVKSKLGNKNFIPVSEPLITKDDIKAVTKTVKSGWVSSIGKEIKNFERNFF